jgi:hypothetical protein
VEVHILTRLAQCELPRGERAKDRERLELALDLGVRAQLLPQDLAQTRFALALALPSLEAARARDLAWEARAWVEATGRHAELRQANQFLATFAAGPP